MAGTYEVQNISVASPHPGELEVTGDLIGGLSATSVLVVLYLITNHSESADVYYVSRESHQQGIEAAVNVIGGIYGVSVFILEENGLPHPRVAAIPLQQAVKYHSKGIICI